MVQGLMTQVMSITMYLSQLIVMSKDITHFLTIHVEWSLITGILEQEELE